MTSHFVCTSGYECFPEYPTLEEAREVLAGLVAEDLAMVRRRYGRATKVENGKDSYTILIGGRQSASIWSSHWIKSFV